MKMSEQLKRISDKLKKLRKLDRQLAVFGARRHKYRLNKTKTEKELVEFEHIHQIKLPEEYRAFLTHIGNGGAGPYYGLETLEDGCFSDLDYKDSNDLVDLSKPFSHTKYWNIDFGKISKDEYDQKEEEYYDNKWVNGLLRISNFGCGVNINLVVNGAEYGNIWVDDRCNDQGIYPDPYFKTNGRVTFLEWYELWLNQALAGSHYP